MKVTKRFLLFFLEFCFIIFILPLIFSRVWKAQGQESLITLQYSDVSLTSACSYYILKIPESTLNKPLAELKLLEDIKTLKISSVKEVYGKLRNIRIEWKVNETYNISIPEYNKILTNITCSYFNITSNKTIYHSWKYLGNGNYNCDLINLSYFCVNIYSRNLINDTCEYNSSIIVGYHKEKKWKWNYNLIWEKNYERNEGGINLEELNKHIYNVFNQVKRDKYLEFRVCGEYKFRPTPNGWGIAIDHIPSFSNVEYSWLAWWNSTWLRRRNITINNSANDNDLLEYQVFINVTYDNDMQPDFDDLRFTYYNSSSGLETEIPYWIENKVDSSYAEIWVKVPEIPANSNALLYMYYGNPNVDSKSDLEATFSYSEPRIIGYVISDRMVNNGLKVLSLCDGNTIQIGSTSYNLNELEFITITSGLSKNTTIKTKCLVQVEGGGTWDDIIVPISWAGTEFIYDGFRDTNDTFCMLAPFGDASVTIYVTGTSQWSGTVNSIGTCVEFDATDDTGLRIVADKPILVAYYGAGGRDAWSFYPATTETLYGVPSQYMIVAAGPSGATINYTRSDTGASTIINVATNEDYQKSGLGQSASGPAVKVETDNPIGVIQQADHDGTESSIFAPIKEMTTKFGSALSAEYIAIATPYSDTNCSVYNSSGFVMSQTASGSNGIYKVCFGCGNDTTNQTGPWKVECTRPVWPYYEEDSGGEETNLLGWKQMRQYSYPEPSYLIGSEEKGDATPPTYSSNSTNSTIAGTAVSHNLYWEDNTGLSGFIFSWYNGANWTFENITQDLESGEVEYKGVAVEKNKIVGEFGTAYNLPAKEGDWNEDWLWVPFKHEFATTPIVIHQPNYNSWNYDSNTADTRIKGVNTTGFYIRVESMDDRGSYNSVLPNGTIDAFWLAIEPGIHNITSRDGSYSVIVEARKVTLSKNDCVYKGGGYYNANNNINFQHSWTNLPILLIALQTANNENVELLPKMVSQCTSSAAYTTTCFNTGLTGLEYNICPLLTQDEDIGYVAWEMHQSTVPPASEARETGITSNGTYAYKWEAIWETDSVKGVDNDAYPPNSYYVTLSQAYPEGISLGGSLRVDGGDGLYAVSAWAGGSDKVYELVVEDENNDDDQAHITEPFSVLFFNSSSGFLYSNETEEIISSEANTTYTTYNDVLSGDLLELIENITVIINVSAYNNSGSTNNGNNNPDLWLEIYNGSNWIGIGSFGITGVGNYSLSTQNPTILSAWRIIDNRDIRIKGIYLDYNSSSAYDKINYTDVWVKIDSTGEFLNDSWVPFTTEMCPSPYTACWSNVTKLINSSSGAIIKWRVYANDSYNNWNSSELYTYVTKKIYLEVTLIEPNTTITNNIIEKLTFLINASVTCRNGDCGNVNGTALYNLSSLYPDTPINTTFGDKPFFIQESPALATKECSNNPLLEDETCYLTWTVNASGDPNTIWKIGVLFNSSSSLVESNYTENATIFIAPCTIDFTLTFTNISFGILNPNTYNISAIGNANDEYNITINPGSCNLDLYIKGTDLVNSTYNSVLKVGNLTWSNISKNINDGYYHMDYTYSIIKSNVPQNTNTTLWFWINVPPIYAGYYNGTVYIEGVKYGESP